MKRFFRWLAIDVRDVQAYGGLALVAGGVWMVWQPGAFIVFGLGLVVFTRLSWT